MRTALQAVGVEGMFRAAERGPETAEVNVARANVSIRGPSLQLQTQLQRPVTENQRSEKPGKINAVAAIPLYKKK